ncbi:hypothetical protein OHA18_42855 [Kribbella sp. NBC_00709]|uniref:hypothetical protein n=1 Tax=Kribbella sp. NBC_00709 TaxID=2975972 RepID=UPI002E2D53BC|nr:hypothetical protein [Kribbella sp. NBC_00709]
MSSRRFRLIRHQDVSGVSGTGPVAEGVQFTDGSVALRWYGDYPTTTVWDGIDSVIAIHGHGGATEVEWLDPEPGPDPDLKLPPRESLPPRPWPDLHSTPEPQDPDPLHHDVDGVRRSDRDLAADRGFGPEGDFDRGKRGAAPPSTWTSYRVFR